MPITYPPSAPAVQGDYLLIHQLLQSPTLIARRLRTIAENRYISDALLTSRIPVSGGAVLYQQGESIFTDRAPEPIRPGGEYPQTGLGFGPMQAAEVLKWGQDVPVTDEAIKRLNMDPVNRAFTKLVNQNVRTVDSIALAAIASQATNSSPATAVWDTGNPVILRDLLVAVAKVRALNQGFEMDTVAVDDLTFAYVASDPTIAQARAREDDKNPVYTGDFPVIAGLRVLPTPNLPPGTQALLVDSSQLGGMADEKLGGPGYTGAVQGVETKSIRDDDEDEYRLRARRVTVPVVIEPSAAIRITGVRS